MERGPLLNVAIEAPTESHASLQNALADSGVVTPTAAGDNNTELAVAVGPQGVRASVAADPSVPIFPVGVDAEWSPATDATVAITELLEEVATTGLAEIPTTTHHQLEISVGERDADNTTDTPPPSATAVCDCSVIASEPARISEYAVSTAEAPIATFRADGVVIATPLGSAGYSRAAGGPRLAPKTGVAVVPIAPFAMQADQWVLNGSVSVSVKRETSVSVYADERAVVEASQTETVHVESGKPFTLIDWRWLRSQQEKLETL